MDTLQKTKEEVNYDKISNSETSMDIKSVSNFVGSITDAPAHIIDNEFIVKGYRVGFDSCLHATKSLCMCHNETVNVWTHLLGALITVFFIVYTSITLGPIESKIKSQQNVYSFMGKDNLTNYSIMLNNSNRLLEDYKIALRNFSDKLSNSDFNKSEAYKLSINSFLNVYENLENIEDLLPSTYDKEYFKECFSFFEIFINNIKDIDNILTNILSLDTQSIIQKLNNITKTILQKINMLNSNNSGDKNLSKIIDFYKDDAQNRDLVKWPVFVQNACALICLLSSSTFHLFYVISNKIGKFLARLDYAGIALLIAGSCFPPYYYMFYCQEIWKYCYLAFISTFSLIVFVIALYPEFGTPAFRKIRGSLFLLLGISTAVPFIHLYFFNNPGMIQNPRLVFWILGGVVYIVGCIIYICRFPEKKFQGIFDYVGSSHNIWHIMVFIGITLHHYAAVDTYYDRLNSQCPV